MSALPALLLLGGCAAGDVVALEGWGDGDADVVDTAPPDDDPVEPAPAGSGCTVTPSSVRCGHRTFELDPGPLDAARAVHVAVPPGPPPPGGWPVAFAFQGSFFGAELFFSGDEGDPFGGLHQARVVEGLLAGGFAVLAPETHLGGDTFWDTNVPPYSFAWTTSPDHRLMVAIFDALDAGDLGPLDPDRLVAFGISSGGYMTSRMAQAYPGRFRALAIHSAAWATCSGALCVVPRLPAGHPPTLFLHGEDDLVVPMRTAEGYERDLRAQGTATDFVSDPQVGHAWLPAAPGAIGDWFTTP